MLAHRILQESVKLMQQGSFIEAEQQLLNLINIQPENADAWQLVAACEKNLGKIDSALTSFKKSLQLNPAQPHTWNNLANLHLQKGEHSAAIRAYRKALSLNPKYDGAWTNLALALTNSGAYEEALSVYADLIKKYPNEPQLLLGMGDCLRENKKLEMALDAYLQALKVSPEKFLPLFKIGVTYRELSRWEESKYSLEKCLELSPDSAAAKHHLASVEAAMGNPTQAISLFEECVQLEPGNPEHHKWLNKLIWSCEHSGFLASYQKLPESLKLSQKFLIDHCKFLNLSGNPEEAEFLLLRAISRGAEEPEILSELASTYCSQGKIVEAISLLEPRVSISSPPNLLDELGRAYLQAEKFDKSLEIYQDLSRKHPLNQGFWCMKATALQQLGTPEATELLDYKNLIQVFDLPAPPGFSSIKAFNEELAGRLTQLHSTKREPLDQSLLGGTQTLNNLFDNQDPIIQLLKEGLRSVVREHLTHLTYKKGHPFLERVGTDIDFVGSWSVNLKRQGHHRSHFHTEGWLSSAYYVDIPGDIEKNGEGWIEFGQPEFDIPGKNFADYSIKPKQGSLVLFPSYMWHGTRPFHSSSRRMTVAFDATPR